MSHTQYVCKLTALLRFGLALLSTRHELKKIEQEALGEAALQGVAPSKGVMDIVRAVKEKANKVTTQVSADRLTSNKSKVPGLLNPS